MRARSRKAAIVRVDGVVIWGWVWWGWPLGKNERRFVWDRECEGFEGGIGASLCLDAASCELANAVPFGGGQQGIL